MLSELGCPVFQLHRERNVEINETADLTFFTWSSRTCLLACFDFAPCEVAAYDRNEEKCQLFTTRGITDLNRITKSDSDVYFRICQGCAFLSKFKILLATFANKKRKYV